MVIFSGNMVVATETELSLYVIDWKEVDTILSGEEGKAGIRDLIGDGKVGAKILYSGRKQRENQISFTRANDSKEALRNGFSKLEEIEKGLRYTIHEQGPEGQTIYERGKAVKRSIWYYYKIVSQEDYLNRIVKEDNQQLPLPI